jgi:recombination protein RecT
MANPETVTKALLDAPKTTSIQDLIKKSAKELGKALPEHMRPERLVRIALTCLRTNPELSKCTTESLLGSLFTAAQIGLEPVAGRAYLLPFNNKRKIGNEWRTVKEAQLVIGYRGLADLFYRHEKSLSLEWGVVQEGDEFDYQMGTSAHIKHKPALKGRGAPFAYYVIATLKNGGKLFHVMGKEECLEHGKKHSKTYDRTNNEFYKSSPWATAFDAMALKTVLIQLAKLLPLSIELQKAISVDETSREYKEGVSDAMEFPETTSWDVEAEIVKDTDAGTAQEPTAGPVLGAKV